MQIWTCLCIVNAWGLSNCVRFLFCLKQKMRFFQHICDPCTQTDYVLTMTLCVYRSLGRCDMFEYMTTHHRAPRMVLAAAGGKSWYRLALSQQGTATANGQTYEVGWGGVM